MVLAAHIFNTEVSAGYVALIILGVYLLFHLLGAAVTAIIVAADKQGRLDALQRFSWTPVMFELTDSGPQQEWDPDEQYRNKRKQVAWRQPDCLTPRIRMFAISQDDLKREVPEGGTVFLGETVEMYAIV